jgi:perosamine synthetase
MLASATSILLAGATPVFVDVEPDTLCLDVSLSRHAVTSRTKAVMLVTLNGRSPDLNEWVRWCGDQGLHLVEDAAQSLGSRYRGRHLGTFGAVGSFSFSAPKVITTGQGGALVTDDDALARRIRQIKDFGRRKAGEDFYEYPGLNFKFTDLQAVIGIEQMKKLAWRVERKKAMYGLYREALNGVPGITLLPTNLEDVSPWFIDVLVPDPDALQAALATEDIGSRRFYPALHSQPAFGLQGSYPHASHAAEHGLWLPSSSFLSDDDIARVCAAARRFAESA